MLPIELDLPAPSPSDIDWGDDAAPTSRSAPAARPRAGSGAGDDDEPAEGEERDPRSWRARVEVLREKSFADLTEEERAAGGRADPRGWPCPCRASARGARARRRRVRRSTSAGRSGGRCARRASRSNGPGVRAGSRHRPLVLILDVSGSMAPYSRALLQFAFAAMAAGRRVEVFVFGTRLTRVTRTLRTQGPRPRAARDRRQVAGLGGRHPDRRVPARRCWTGGASGRRCAAPSSCCAPTAWSGATRSCCARRWRGSGGWPTGSSG